PVVAVDASPLALDQARAFDPAQAGKVQWFAGDVRRLPHGLTGLFDLIVEHACFCALAPPDRGTYLDQLARMLRPAGLLAGLFYVDAESRRGPPFGISEEDLRKLLESRFKILSWESP